jgi:hypothetical protein
MNKNSKKYSCETATHGITNKGHRSMQRLIALIKVGHGRYECRPRSLTGEIDIKGDCMGFKLAQNLSVYPGFRQTDVGKH